jgi:hypothetical protein
MGADNNPPLVVVAVVERVALMLVQELRLQNLVLHRSVAAKLRLHLLQVERTRKLSILLMSKTGAD